jgi:hypothetical protein
MTRAITPDEATEQAAAAPNIPDPVFEVFNELIVKNLRDGEAHVLQDDAVTAISGALTVERQDVLDNHWLDVEDAYRAQGWVVDYDKPGYNETYSAFFTFKRPR